MLSHLGCREGLGSHFAVVGNRRARDQHAPCGRMVEFLQVAVDARLLVVEQHPVVGDLGNQDVDRG